jgi:hypothetical protein
MLSLSADMSGQEVDLQVINGRGGGGVRFGSELAAFAEAVASRDEAALAQARAHLFDAAGNDVLVDAAGVAANFQRMVRIADATGIPSDGFMAALGQDIQQQLDLRRFESARNTPVLTLVQKLKAIPLRLIARRLVHLADRHANRTMDKSG